MMASRHNQTGTNEENTQTIMDVDMLGRRPLALSVDEWRGVYGGDVDAALVPSPSKGAPPSFGDDIKWWLGPENDDKLMISPTALGKASSDASPSPSSVHAVTKATGYGSGVAPDEIGLTPIEIRRKRNREAMQRTRQRQRDDIEAMKITVRELEKEFQRLKDGKQPRGKTAPGAGAFRMCQGVPIRPLDRLEADYHALADMSRRLKEERFMLERMFMEKQKTFRRLQQAMVDRKSELGLACPTTTTSPESLYSDFDYVPIKERDADVLMKRCYDDIGRLERLSEPWRASDGKGSTGHGPFTPTSTFGWCTNCHLLPNSGYFVSFTKTFDHVRPEDVMLKTWTLFARPENNVGDARNVIRMETLQTVNENATVVARDVPLPQSPKKRLRSIFLRFRLYTETGGYVIGRASMNPTDPELRAQQEDEDGIVYGDYSSWIEFRASNGSGMGCHVKFGAICAFDTCEDMQFRLVNALLTTIMWETAVIAPPMLLT